MPYSFKATETFTADASRTFGIEIEFKSNRSAVEIADALTAAGIATHYEGYNHITRATWKIVSDASVRGGWELVSPPMRFEDASFAQIEIVSRVLIGLGARIDRECGLHVHHHAADLAPSQIGKIVALYAKHEAQIDAMMPASRRANGYCKSLDVKRNLPETVASMVKCKTVHDLEGLFNDRYYKVNVYSLRRHSTIEFRQHSGTVEAAKIINWVKITRALLEKGAAVKTVTVKSEVPYYHRFFRLVCGKELAAYIRERTAALAA